MKNRKLTIWIQGVQYDDPKCDVCENELENDKYIEGMQFYCSSKCLAFALEDDEEC